MKRIGMLAAVMAIGAFGCASNQNKQDTDPDKKEVLENDKTDLDETDVTPKDGDDTDLARETDKGEDEETPPDETPPEAKTGE